MCYFQAQMCPALASLQLVGLREPYAFGGGCGSSLEPRAFFHCFARKSDSILQVKIQGRKLPIPYVENFLHELSLSLHFLVFLTI